MKRLLLLLALASAPVACVDATHDAAVSKLGGETPGVPQGPLHRPGQPCVTCHGGEGPGESEFSVAGTVYLFAYDPVVPAPAVTVVIQDINGVAVTIPTNEAGTFYISAKDWQPTFPLKTEIRFGKIKKQMQTNIGRTGSCGDCHQMDATPTSAGKVYVALNSTQLNKAMQAP
jgi:cytochrome c553